MVRVTNYFDTQIRMPIVTSVNGSAPLDAAGTAFLAHLKEGGKTMTEEQVIGWYGKVLDGVKQRYRKLQRLAR